MTKLTLEEIEDLLIEAEDLVDKEDIDDIMDSLKTPIHQEFFDYVYGEVCKHNKRGLNYSNKTTNIVDTIEHLQILYSYLYENVHKNDLYKLTIQLVHKSPPCNLFTLEKILLGQDLYLKELQ